MKDFFEIRQISEKWDPYGGDEPNIPDNLKKKLIRSAESLQEHVGEEEAWDMEFPEDYETVMKGKGKEVRLPADLRKTNADMTQFPKGLVVYAYEGGGSNPGYAEAAMFFERYKVPSGPNGDEIKRWLFWAVADVNMENPFGY